MDGAREGVGRVPRTLPDEVQLRVERCLEEALLEDYPLAGFCCDPLYWEAIM